MVGTNSNQNNGMGTATVGVSASPTASTVNSAVPPPISMPSTPSSNGSPDPNASGDSIFDMFRIWIRRGRCPQPTWNAAMKGSACLIRQTTEHWLISIDGVESLTLRLCETKAADLARTVSEYMAHARPVAEIVFHVSSCVLIRNMFFSPRARFPKPQVKRSTAKEVPGRIVDTPGRRTDGGRFCRHRSRTTCHGHRSQ